MTDGARYTIDRDGYVHRFFSDAKGGTNFHWSVSTADQINPFSVPPGDLKQLGLKPNGAFKPRSER